MIIEFVSSLWWLNALIFFLGLAALVRGSDWFVEGSAYVAEHYGISDVVIGLTLVSIGTSLPELVANVYASSLGEGVISLGNIVGSNVANIGLVLGLGVVVAGSLAATRVLLGRDLLWMLGVYALFSATCLLTGGDAARVLSRLEGLFLLLAGLMYFVILARHRDDLTSELRDETTQVTAEIEVKVRSPLRAWLLVVVGGVLIVPAAKAMVDTLVWAAEYSGLSKELIAATIVAFGTSVPELSVTLSGIRKGKPKIAVGNIVGSCIVNIVLIMSVSALISPVVVTAETPVLLGFMVATGVLLFVFMRTNWRLERWEGIVLVSCYGAFLTYNVIRLGQ